MACLLQHSNIAFISPLRRFRVINIGSIVNTATHMNNSVEKAKSGIGNLGVNQWTSYFWVREMAIRNNQQNLKRGSGN